jgi:hypothetical protein
LGGSSVRTAAAIFAVDSDQPSENGSEKGTEKSQDKTIKKNATEGRRGFAEKSARGIRARIKRKS